MTERDIRADERRQIRVAAERDRKKRDRIYNEYMRYLREDYCEEEAMDLICERFECTPRKVENILMRRAGSLNPHTKALSEANLLMTLSKLADVSSLATSRYVAQLRELDENTDEWVDVAQSQTVGGKGGESITTQRVSKAEYRAKIYDRLQDTIERPVKAIERLLPKNVINFQDRRTEIQSMSIDELNALIDETSQTLKGNHVDQN